MKTNKEKTVDYLALAPSMILVIAFSAVMVIMLGVMALALVMGASGHS